jgi:hypothetical protein
LAHSSDKKEGVGGGGQVMAQAGLEGGPKMFDGVEIGRGSVFNQHQKNRKST